MGTSIISSFDCNPEDNRATAGRQEERDAIPREPCALRRWAPVAGELLQVGGGQEHSESLNLMSRIAFTSLTTLGAVSFPRARAVQTIQSQIRATAAFQPAS
jgi:hypothetical protein